VADPNRLAILRRLRCEGSVAACDFRCCNVGQPTVSHHLRVLREAGWVRTERRASRVYYSLTPGAAERFRAIAGELMPLPSGDSAALTPVPELGPTSRKGGW
jgi:ArsR family transcriptional regulator